MSFRDLKTTDDLREVCDQARAEGRVGLDTEFLWERTYAPQICLVQIGTQAGAAIADPLEGIDLQPVADLLVDPAVQVVMHAPHADLFAFAHHYGAPATNVFDTQISAGFAGLSAGLAYDRLAAELVGAKLHKSESFTDWSKRPLTDKQLRYAAEDVEHLFGMAEEITARLEKFGRVDWAREEMVRRFEDPARLTTPLDEAYRKVARRSRLNPREMAVLQAVARWRELTARKRDVPVSWVIKDATLIELARRTPANERELTRIRGVESSLRRGDPARLVEAVREGTNAPPIPEPPAPPRTVRKRVNIGKGLAMALMRAQCEAVDLAPELVGTSGDVEDLIGYIAQRALDGHAGDDVAGDPDDESTPSLLRGWRRNLAGMQLIALLDGRLTLQLSDRDPFLVVHEHELH